MRFVLGFLTLLLALNTLVIVAPAASAQNGDAPPGLEVETDEFTGRVTIKPFREHPVEIEEFDGEEITVGPIYMDGPENPPSWTLVVHIHAKTSRVEGLKRVYVLINGERHVFEDLRIDSSTARAVEVLDQIAIRLTPDQFRTIAQAETVRMKVGDATFAFPHEERWSMRRIIKYVNGR